MAVNYFDVYTTLNNPIKLSMQLALIVTMFCLLCEFRIRLGEEKRGQHLAFSLLGAVLCAYFSIPTILAYVLGKTQNLRYLFAAIACLAICAYALRVSLLFSEASEFSDIAYEETEEALNADADNECPEVEKDG